MKTGIRGLVPALLLCPGLAGAGVWINEIHYDNAGTDTNERIEVAGVTICGPLNLPSSVPQHASTLYGKNLATLLTHVCADAKLVLDAEDEITSGTLVVHRGRVVSERVRALISALARKPEISGAKRSVSAPPFQAARVLNASTNETGGTASPCGAAPRPPRLGAETSPSCERQRASRRARWYIGRTCCASCRICVAVRSCAFSKAFLSPRR